MQKYYNGVEAAEIIMNPNCICQGPKPVIFLISTNLIIPFPLPLWARGQVGGCPPPLCPLPPGEGKM
jgi:hypothetical protein